MKLRSIVFPGLLFLIIPALGGTGWGAEEPGPRNSAMMVGRLPYSLQWYYEKPHSFLYLTYNQMSLRNSQMEYGTYLSDLKSTQFTFYSLDYFTQILRMETPHPRGAWDGFSLWARYSIGAGVKQGQLQSRNFALTASSSSSSLTALFGAAGLQLGYERWAIFHPFVGIQLRGFAYRHSAGMSGAEADGNGLTYEPLLGAHFVIPETQFSAFCEARRTIAFSDDKAGIVDTAVTNLSGGIGLVF